MKTNLILATDSYKFSHWVQMPTGTESAFFYVESRGGKYDETVFFGLQYYIKEYLSKPITQEDIEEAANFTKMHGVPFNREGWEYILNAHKGFLPLRIRAVPEGTRVPTHNVLMTIESTDPKCYWLPSYMETLLLKVWYPTTIASRSYKIKQLILSALEKSSDDPKAEIGFKLHSFGYRGVSSEESAGIGGAAELISFLGSDTVMGIRFANHYYNCDMAGFSIPAMEHSTVTSFGKDHEVEAYRNMLNHFAKPGSLVACVSDSYDLWHCISQYWGKELKEQVIKSGATVIVRPDSGNPPIVVLKTLQLLDESYGHTVNSKGYKVLNYVRVIQGDGINEDSIKEILDVALTHGYSATNLAFGMGGGMLSDLTRDTNRFAMKCSSVRINGVEIDVSKNPITDPGKASKAGRLDLVKKMQSSGVAVQGPGYTPELPKMCYSTEVLPDGAISHPYYDTAMNTVYYNGKIMDETFETIRSRAAIR